MFQTIYNRHQFVTIQIKARTTAEHTPDNITRQKSATQRQRNHSRRPSKHQQQRQPQERRPHLPAEERTEDPRQIIRQRRNAAELPEMAAATTTATPTAHRVKLQNFQERTDRGREHTHRTRHKDRRPALIDPAEEIPTAEQKPFKRRTTRRDHTANAVPA